MTYSYLSEFGQHTDNWLIRVRVCRLWESVNPKERDNNLISMDMVLIDEKENLMHAVVRKHLVPRFGHLLREGLVYSLRNVRLAKNTYPYRPLASDVKLLFLATTSVRELTDGTVNIPLYGFQFTTQDVLQSRANDTTVLSDVVGCLRGFGGVEEVSGGFKKRDIKIFTDYSVNSTITLWGKLGEVFDPATYREDGGSYVVVVSSVTVKTFQGALTFSTTSGSKVYVNPEVAHVSSIRERFSALSTNVEAFVGPSITKLAPEEEMFLNRMTVDALVKATYAGELTDEVVTLKATIIGINSKKGWYYVACITCLKKLTTKDGVYVCSVCGPVEPPLTLFRINVQIQDASGSTTIVFLNTSAERLLDTSAKKLIKKMAPDDYSVPQEMLALVGKEYVFKLKLNDYNLVEGLQDYGVSTVFTPMEDLEAAYEKTGTIKACDTQAGSSSNSGADPGKELKRKRKLSPSVQERDKDDHEI